MIPARLRILVSFYCYGGNGGLAMMAPELAMWWAKTYHEMKQDPRIESVAAKVYSDTPITMTRNRAVRDAKLHGCDMILMLDSDNEPDPYVAAGNDAKPFWKTAFDFAYDRLVRGIPTVIAAPYCGPPPPPIEQHYVVTNGDVTYTEQYGGEVPYLFQWSNKESGNPHANLKIDLMTRNEAARLSGIYPVAALPTGVCLFTTNAFDGLPQPYFRYEMNADGSEKESTEDVVATRDISLYWKITKGYDVLFATCDSWALHHKTKKVGRPQFVPVDSVAEVLVDAIKLNQRSNEAIENIDYTSQLEGRAVPLPHMGQVLGPDDSVVIISESQMERARQQVEAEKSNGHSHPDVPAPAEEVDPVDTEISEEGPIPCYDGPPRPTLEYTTVQGKKVAVFDGFRIPEEDLTSVGALTDWLHIRRGGALEVAVVHSGTGQSAAAINSSLPEGSHLYAIDCFTPHKFSTLPAENFNQSFAREIETGRVHVDNMQRKMPHPETQQHLDMVFIEQFLTPEKLEKWLPHVQGGGLLAGLGFAGKARPLVRKFADQKGLTLQSTGDVWALRIGLRPTPVIEQPADDDERVDLEALAELTDE